MSGATALFTTGRDGTRIHVRLHEGPAAGASPVTALLTDGIACDGFIWKYLWDDLARWMRVAHWNYRGHGRSGRRSGADAAIAAGADQGLSCSLSAPRFREAERRLNQRPGERPGHPGVYSTQSSARSRPSRLMSMMMPGP